MQRALARSLTSSWCSPTPLGTRRRLGRSTTSFGWLRDSVSKVGDSRSSRPRSCWSPRRRARLAQRHRRRVSFRNGRRWLLPQPGAAIPIWRGHIARVAHRVGIFFPTATSSEGSPRPRRPAVLSGTGSSPRRGSTQLGLRMCRVPYRCSRHRYVSRRLSESSSSLYPPGTNECSSLPGCFCCFGAVNA